VEEEAGDSSLANQILKFFAVDGGELVFHQEGAVGVAERAGDGDHGLFIVADGLAEGGDDGLPRAGGVYGDLPAVGALYESAADVK
jgi:hypothetical protein